MVSQTDQVPFQFSRLLTIDAHRAQGYAVFLKGEWQVSTFIFDYGIVSIYHSKCWINAEYLRLASQIALAGGIGIGWKIIKRTHFHRSENVDLVSGLQFFDALTEHYRIERDVAPVTTKDRILAKIF